MKIAHVALWTTDIDRLASFWKTMFGARIGALYESKNRPGFRSRFIQLADGATIEIMSGTWIIAEVNSERVGYAHIAISLGSREAVDALASKASDLGILSSRPRMTGDGFYEAVIIDPDGNPVEVTS
jgi:lactoylglutathione lyase